MNRTTLTAIALFGLLCGVGTRAQTPEPASTAPMPAVNTSAEAAPAQPAEQGPKATPGPAPANAAPTDTASSAQPAEQAKTPAAGKENAPASTADASKGASGSGRDPKGNDRLQLGTTEISGNRELPKVLYVVPWRRAEIGDAVGRPPNSLVEEALTPVDRDVFRRQNRYYAALEAGAAPAKSQPAAASRTPPHAAP
jgi:hypothetical protein